MRTSLLDFMHHQSWIKKTNYEGIFNLFIILFWFSIVSSPLVSPTSLTKQRRLSRMGTLIDLEFLGDLAVGAGPVTTFYVSFASYSVT